MIVWNNLWHQFWLAPGTRRYRILLSLWQVWLMVASGIGGALFGWLGVLGGFVVAWLSHELFFIGYAEHVVGLKQFDYYPYQKPGTNPSYVATIERWTGPFASDPNNTQVG